MSQIANSGMANGCGVLVERRQFLWLSLSAVTGASLLPVLGSESPFLQVDSSPAGWKQFVASAGAVAAEAVRGRLEEERLLSQLAALLGELDNFPEGGFAAPTKPFEVDPLQRGYPLAISRIRFAPGARLPIHDHREYNGAMKVIAGDIRSRSFEIVGDDRRPPAERAFIVKETRSQQLPCGAISTLSRVRDNLHGLEAGPHGATILDVFTKFHSGAYSMSAEVADQPFDQSDRLFVARWTSRL